LEDWGLGDGIFHYLIKCLGGLFRYLYFRGKYSYPEILKQEYNGRVGVIVLGIIIMLTIYFAEKY